MNDRYECFDDLLDDVLRVSRQGDRPNIDALCEQFPRFSEEIRELLPSVLLMEAIKPSNGCDSGQTSSMPDPIEGYQIIREIGRGGMGVVYEAEHAALQRRVALKVLPDRLSANAEAIERFRREARAIARLHHSNIVPVFEVGDDHGRLFLAMQLISGPSLYEVVSELRHIGANFDGDFPDLLRPPSSGLDSSSSFLSIRPLNSTNSSIRSTLSDSSVSSRNRHFRSVARIGLQTADALHYAHQRGVIHRDVKPSNLLLDKNGIVWLTDFGLAKTEDDQLTRTGDFVGTLKYMAPERFNGICDARSDLYSVGLTLYELLAMRPAFDAPDRLKLIEQIVQSEPSHLRTLVRGIPRDLETIVMKTIDREPKSRYQTAKALADDLDRYLNDQPIQARPHSIPEKLIRWSRRNRGLAASLAGTMVMALLTIVVLAVSLRTSRKATEEARAFASRSLLMQADSAFDNRQFQSATLLAAASLEIALSDAATAKLQSSRASTPATLRWTSPTLNDVTAVARSRDGRFIAASSAADDQIQIWHADSLTLARCIQGHDQTVTSLACSSDGDWVLSGSQDQAVRLWDSKAGTLKWSHSLQSAPASIAIDPTRQLAAAGGVFRGTVWIWDCSTGRLRHRFVGDGSPVRDIAFDRLGKFLAAGFENGKTQVWNLKTAQSKVLAGASSVNSLVFLDDGRLAVGMKRGLSLWDVEKGTAQRMGRGDESLSQEVTVVCNSLDGTELAAGSSSGVIRYFDALTLIENRNDRIDVGNPLSHLAYCIDARHLIVGVRNEGPRSADQSIRLIERANGESTAWTEGHVGVATQFAFSADGGRLVSTANDRTIRVWDTKQGTVIRRLDGFRQNIQCVAIDPLGSIIASGGTDKTLRLHHAKSGKQAFESRRLAGPIRGVAFESSGDVLASSTTTRIQFWKLDHKRHTLKEIRSAIQFKNPNEVLVNRGLCFCPRSDLIVCGTSRGRVLFWSASTGESVVDFRPDENRPIRGLQFNADGSKLAVLCHERIVKVYDVTDPAAPKESSVFPLSSVRSMSFDPNGQMLVTANFDQTVNLWSVATGQPLGQIEGHRGAVNAMKFGPQGKLLVTSSNAELKMWDLAPSDQDMIRGATIARAGYQWNDYYDMLFAFEFSSNENLMFIRGLWDNGYQGVLLNRATGQQRAFKGAHGGDIGPRDRWLAVGTKAGDLGLYPLDNSERLPLEHERFPLEHDGTEMKSIVFNVDGTLLAGIGPTHITLWDVAQKKRLYSFPAHNQGIRHRLVFHPTNPHLLVSGGDDSMVYLWSVKPGGHKRLRQFEGHGGMVGLLAFSSDGKSLASCDRGEAPAALLWDVESGSLRQRFIGHQVRINAVDVSPDGRSVATASNDSTVRLWNVEDGSELRRFQSHSNHVYMVQFVDGGNRLASASADGTIRFHDLKTSDRPHQLTREQLEAEMGLRLDGEHIRPIRKQVRWHVEPTYHKPSGETR